jgi:peptidoglycan/LPS O-acetylase OafA/YrhL
MLFYLAFTCAILLKLKRSKLVFLAGAFAVLSLLSRFLPSGSGIRYLLSEPIIIEFLYGVLAAEILLRLPATRNVRWMRILPIVLISFGAIAIFCTVKLDFPGSMRFAVYGLPALLIVLGAAMRGPEHCPRILVYLGDASYSIYIMHGFFSMAYGTALKHFSVLGRLPSDAVIVVAGIATITLSSFTYPLIERRLTKALSPAKSLPVLSA